MYQRMLVPMDGSPLCERVLPYVRELAKGLQLPVHLFRVFDPQPEFFYPDIRHYQERLEAAAQLRQQIEESLDKIKSSLQDLGLDASSTVHDPGPASHEGHSGEHVIGDPAHHIVDEAAKEAGTLIVMCTHGRSGVGRWIMGSVTDKVLHATTNPLLIVRAATVGRAPAEHQIDSVVVPLDGSALAERILPHAVFVAQGLGLKVRPVRVTPTDIADADAAHHLREVRERLEQDGVATAAEQVLHGDPANVIVDLTEETPGSLVAMTTHGRSGIARWVVGSVAERVIHYAASPVLVVRASSN